MHRLAGIYCAAVTPLKSDFTPDLDAIPVLLDFLAKRGCHGVLMLGTTGEGPSFSPQERHDILYAALKIRQDHPSLKVLVGTGTPSLSETILLTKTAFDLGVDGVVVLPPYYYRGATDEGLFNYFGELIRKGMPKDGCLLGYHIPRADRYWFHARSS
jgi:4-hydroxy-tetrahydrodipicolinate synthase